MNNVYRVFITLCLTLSPLVSTALATEEVVMAIELEIPTPAAARRYRPPFVAIWLEELDGTAATTIEVWYNRDRWLPDLNQWWRKLGSGGTSNYDAVTGATHRPGIHIIEWDGKDVFGNQVEVGEYWLWVEIVREHGGSERIKLKIDLSQPGSTAQVEGSSEIGKIRARIN